MSLQKAALLTGDVLCGLFEFCMLQFNNGIFMFIVFEHQLFQFFCLFLFREESTEKYRRKDRAFLDELGELGAAMNSAKAPTPTP